MARPTSEEPTAGAGRCPSCGAAPIAGFADCAQMWERLQLQSLTELAYGRFRRAIVDAYALQHPETYCRSGKSYAAHLTGACVAVEHGGDPRINAAVQRWLSGNRRLDKPAIPATRGDVTIADVLAGAPPGVEPGRLGTVLDGWLRSAWQAYGAHHELARRWIREALERAGRPG